MQTRSPQKQPSSSAGETLLVLGSREELDLLAPWISVKSRTYSVSECETYPDRGFDTPAFAEMLCGVDAFVCVTEKHRAPSKVLSGLGACDATGRFVFGSTLPLSKRALLKFAESAKEVEERLSDSDVSGPVFLLGEWERRAEKMVSRSRRCLAQAGVRSFVWTSERLGRAELTRGLGLGPGLALYYGHGRSSGWAGYHGFRSVHLPQPNAPAMGALLSITCSTAARSEGRLSFAELAVGRGVAAASLGAVRKTRHLDNAYLASSFCEALASGSWRLHDALRACDLPAELLQSEYRIFGDVTAALLGHADCEVEAERVYAPAPDEKIDFARVPSALSEERTEEKADLAALLGI